MQTLRRTWSGSRLAKVILVLGAMTGLCSLAFLCTVVLATFDSDDGTPPTPAAMTEMTATVAPKATRAATATATPAPPATFTAAPTKAPTLAFTATPIPTATAEPTATPTLTDTPATPLEAMAQAVTAALGEGDRETPRMGDVDYFEEHLVIFWAINRTMSGTWSRLNAQNDMKAILLAVHESGLPMEQVTVHGTFPVLNAYGNIVDRNVFHAAFSNRDLELINWENLELVDFEAVADDFGYAPGY